MVRLWIYCGGSATQIILKHILPFFILLLLGCTLSIKNAPEKFDIWIKMGR